MKHAIILLVCTLVLACGAQAQDTQKTGTAPKSEVDRLKARIDQMEQEIQELKAGHAQPSQPAADNTGAEAAPSSRVAATPSAGGKHLALPDISLVVQAEGLGLTTRTIPPGRSFNSRRPSLAYRLRLPQRQGRRVCHHEPSDHEPAQVEEAYSPTRV